MSSTRSEFSACRRSTKPSADPDASAGRPEKLAPERAIVARPPSLARPRSLSDHAFHRCRCHLGLKPSNRGGEVHEFSS
jgi:hypothetical protein